MSTREPPSRADTVIVGAGAVGCSVAYHLAELGAEDIVVVDQGPLPVTGGSSVHAPGIMFQTSPSKTQTKAAHYTSRLLNDAGVYDEVGGIELARSEERIDFLRRRVEWATSYGLPEPQLLSPAEVTDHLPLVDEAEILGGYYSPTDGQVSGVVACDALAREAMERGAEFVPHTRTEDVVVAGGVEHMTRVEMGSDGSDDDLSDTYFEEFDKKVTQGEAAELIAEKWDFTREEMDQLAVDSQQRWKAAWDDGRYDDQIVPVETELDGEEVVVEKDEHPRPGTDLEALSELPLAFREEGNGVHHAGNSSGIVDGSSALLITSEEVAEERGWDPMARIVETQAVGSDPVLMLTGPIPATEQVLENADMSIDDIDLFEVNEAFASVAAAWMEETGAPWAKTNVNGGAIAHGHPTGATGGALVGKLAHELQRTGADYALSTMCIGFGQGIATLIERV